MSSKRYPEEFKIEAVNQVTDRGHAAAAPRKPRPATRTSVQEEAKVRTKKALMEALALAQAVKIEPPVVAPVTAGKAVKAKPAQAKKVKVVRDNFTMPDVEYAQIVREEADVLPMLAQAGESALVERKLNEHDEMRCLAARLPAAAPATLERFGELLRAHMRFEERELFEVAQRRLRPDDEQYD